MISDGSSGLEYEFRSGTRFSFQCILDGVWFVLLQPQLFLQKQYIMLNSCLNRINLFNFSLLKIACKFVLRKKVFKMFRWIFETIDTKIWLAHGLLVISLCSISGHKTCVSGHNFISVGVCPSFDDQYQSIWIISQTWYVKKVFTVSPHLTSYCFN